MPTSSHKDAAQRFLRLVTEGKIQEAYDTYAGPEFRHHNPWYPSDAASLCKGMQESHENFPEKIFTIRNVAAEGDLVMVHSSLRLQQSMPEMAVVHVFRFQDGRIAEMWDIGQQQPEEMANELGMF